MFSGQNGGGGGGSGTATGTAKRVLSTLLETSGLVCGSLRDTVQERLADSDVDMKWVESEIDNIRTRLERPREHILNLTDKACQMGGRGGVGGEPPSSLLDGRAPSAPGSGGQAAGGSFPDDTTLDGTGTISTAEGRTLTIETADDETATMASTLMTVDSPPSKGNSRFAVVIGEARRRERESTAADALRAAAGGSDVVIGLCLSRKNATLGHPDTVTRQTAFDFNELQDRDYKYVSSTDESGWLAGGGERGDPYLSGAPRDPERDGGLGDGTGGGGGGGSVASSRSEDSDGKKIKSFGAGHKIAAPDRVHIPIIQINASSVAAIDEIVSALARGEIFIPEVSILPETLGVSNASPPDLQVRFGCEKNDDAPPEEWPNWCLEFLHNQLYDYFSPVGARWSRRPFQITLARKVRWMTVKHMNKYFARSEQVINSWREKGPQYLQPPYSDDSSRGVILEEITRPHGIYLIQNGTPTNYFAPNFLPPYTTKMRRSLIRNVINKSWDSKHREWLSEPVPRRQGPVQMLSSVMGCTNPGHLSPVEERVAANSIFREGPDIDPVHDTGPEMPEMEEIPSSRSRKGGRKNEGLCGDDKRQNDLPRHRKEDRPKELDKKPTASIPTVPIPSDESYGTSVRPSGTMSLEETMTDPPIEPIAVDCTASNSVESPGRSKQWLGELSLEKESANGANRKHFFDGGGRGRTSSFGSSSKGVSFSDSSIVESERERKLDPDHHRHHRKKEKHRVEEHECPLVVESQHKADDRRADIFSKTKRREMRDRRQDENGERSTPTSKSSPSRRPNQSPVSPSCDSMAYSLDSASQFRPPVAASSNGNDGGSVFTMGTENQSLLSYVTRSTMVQSRYHEEGEDGKHDDAGTNGEGDDISLSLLESRSSVVPGDEELKAIGWAKALDPNSGSYYYFTLDRTKTVWENPLAMSP